MMFKNFINLKKFENKVTFGFFTSQGGVSTGDYSSLNCNKNSKDKKNNITKNIIIALRNLELENKNLKLINQVHSNRVFDINYNNYRKKLYGDGLITKEKNIALAVLTADCAPIFLFDDQKTIICCLHAGWKGALKNIIKKCIDNLNKKNLQISNINAIIGPCLGYRNFEVDKNLKYKFIKENENYSEFFKYKNKNKDMFNFRGLLNFQLKKNGIKKIYNIKKDTYKNSDIFFSHRRATHQNRIKNGRMINIISLKD